MYIHVVMSILFNRLKKSTAKYGETRDCTVVATAIVLRTTYEDAHNLCESNGRQRRKGLGTIPIIMGVKSRGYRVEPVNEYLVPKTIKGFCKANMSGTYLIFVRGHVLAAKNGKVHDWSDGRCHRIQAMYKVINDGEPIRYPDATVRVDYRPERKKRTSKVSWKLIDTRTGVTVRTYRRAPKYRHSVHRWSIGSDPSSEGHLELRKVY